MKGAQVEAKLIGGGGLAFELGRESLVGRSADCEFRIDEPKVSRKHARIVLDGADVMLEDLGSTNGTFLNGQRVAGRTVLKDGDRVRFHESEFTVSIAAAPVTPAEDPALPATGDDASEEVLAAPPAAAAAASDDVPAPPAKAGDASPPGVVDRSAATDDPYVPGSWATGDDVRATRLLDPGATNELLVNLQNDVDQLPASAKPHFVLIADGQVAETFELDADGDAGEVWTIGRDAGCEVALADPTVSGQHAQVFHQDGQWRLVNLVSANGTSVNGEKCLTAYLSDGDQIDVGLARLVFRAGTPQASAERSSLLARARNWLGRGR